jgi:hypothetical protein
MAPPPLAAASGKQNGPRGRGSVSTELPAEGPAEEEEQDPRHSRRSLRSQSPGDDAGRVARSRAVAYAGAAQGAAAAAHAAAATATDASQGRKKRALRSPERPPPQLKRKRPTASAIRRPPPHIAAKLARTCESSLTASKDNDWTCLQCGNVNWYKRGYCIGGNGQCLPPQNRTWAPGDWYCECGNHNLSRRTVCNRGNCRLSRAQGEKARF